MRPITKRCIGYVVDTGLALLGLLVLTGMGWYQDFREVYLPPESRT